MKRILMTATAVLLISAMFILSGCETTIDISGTDTSAASTVNGEPDTAVVEVTDEEGSVVATEIVTMSADDKNTAQEEFFNVDSQDDSTADVLNDRVNQALNNNRDDKNVTNKNDNNSDEPTLSDEDNETLPDNSYVQDDEAILKSDQYLMDVRVETADGVKESYKIARRGDLSSVSLIYNGYPMTVIFGGETWYWLSNSDKTYLKIPKSMIEESATDEEMKDMLLNNPFDFERKVASRDTEIIDGNEYNVITYEDGTKDYFIGKTIIKTEASDGSVMMYVSVSPIAPASLFVPPADYTETELTDEGASDMVDAITPTTDEKSN